MIKPPLNVGIKIQLQIHKVFDTNVVTFLQAIQSRIISVLESLMWCKQVIKFYWY